MMHTIWAMSSTLSSFKQAIQWQVMAHNSCHQHKAQAIWKVSKVPFDALRMLAWRLSQSVTLTGLIIAPSTSSVEINTGSCIHDHRLFQQDSEQSADGFLWELGNNHHGKQSVMMMTVVFHLYILGEKYYDSTVRGGEKKGSIQTKTMADLKPSLPHNVINTTNVSRQFYKM